MHCTILTNSYLYFFKSLIYQKMNNANIKTQVLNLLTEIKNSVAVQSKTALNIDEVATLTGLSKDNIYLKCSKNKIPFYKGAGGKRNYFNKQEIEKWLLDVKQEVKEGVNYV